MPVRGERYACAVAGRVEGMVEEDGRSRGVRTEVEWRCVKGGESQGKGEDDCSCEKAASVGSVEFQGERVEKIRRVVEGRKEMRRVEERQGVILSCASCKVCMSLNAMLILHEYQSCELHIQF